MRLRIGVLLVIFISLATKGARADSTAGETARIARLQTRIPELMKLATVPGLSIALIDHGRLRWLHGFGVQDVTSGRPVDDDTIFLAASLSKCVFTYAVLELVDQGKLALDVPLTHYLPKPYIDNDPRLNAITARIVLSHRSGFPNWRDEGGPLLIKFNPGERFSYSGEGIVYLQRVVEQITGKPLDEVMQELVFKPLGMTSSSYLWRDADAPHIAIGHDIDGRPLPPFKATHAIAAASLNTTAKDYARFLVAVANGVGLKAATLRDMETPQIAVDPECTNCTNRIPKRLSQTVFWGLGWGIERTKKGDLLWHWGDNSVFKAFVMLDPKTRSGFVMFANGENGLSLVGDIIDIVVGGEQPALTWLKYDRYDSPAMQLNQVARDRGARAALSELDDALKSGAISEDALNGVAYRALSRKRNADAIMLFERNVALHPQSANVYDSLGEAYMNDGQKERAIASYEQSLALNPHNDNAAKMLKKLRP